MVASCSSSSCWVPQDFLFRGEGHIEAFWAPEKHGELRREAVWYPFRKHTYNMFGFESCESCALIFSCINEVTAQSKVRILRFYFFRPYAITLQYYIYLSRWCIFMTIRWILEASQYMRRWLSWLRKSVVWLAQPCRRFSENRTMCFPATTISRLVEVKYIGSTWKYYVNMR